MKTEILLRRHEVQRRTGLSRSEIYLKMKAGRFPQSIKLGARSVAWPESEIDGWIANIIKQARTIVLPSGPGPGGAV